MVVGRPGARAVGRLRGGVATLSAILGNVVVILS
jgi:hypothetical protein